MKAILGNTYAVKDQIKSAGGKWDGTTWRVPTDKWEEIQKLVSSQKNNLSSKNNLPLKGKLWEPCDCCGQEPIYMNVGVCESCAYKGRRR